MSAVIQDEIALNNNNKLIKLVHVLVNDVDIYIPVANAERIVPIVNLLPVPSGPDYLKGLMSLSGETIPVIDLGERMNIYNSTPYTIDTLILICSNNDKTIGLIIDDIIGLETAEHQQVQLQEFFHDSEAPVIAVINSEQGMSLLLDLEKVLDVDLVDHCQELLDTPNVLVKAVVE